MPRPLPPSSRNAGAGQVRIVGGRWRNTRLAVPDVAGLRPSSDRVRETLFNWLTGQLAGARVLDLFAGTGALGLEALSRGAAGAVLVERDPAAARQLAQTVTRLQAEDIAQVVQGDALAWLEGQPDGGFQIAFLDPPFADGLHARVLERLPRLLAPDAWLYLEAPLEQSPALPPGFVLHREGQTRQVRYALARAPG
ncbi:16S rRNA (guanine(966)-N(2))-methyltransferase RsmD [Pseudoxanthomonas winnipegensis]|jgi:16S rRNA (guanine966-N2)-methyltransferase|uniref:Ribosomal RNA small subunit methyltransferase D n=1 Tax=Pseudoxanthomonas winnipegensis TaxID=2480810 RepID=A0A4Q8L8H6_9GAMM|nr:16S rRNA (guanine(966)-N(2))-methyltransferase RsmD [Pseudoxanthomonas winnipegensis]TAA24510.1 16S rRNA (guanine(966)-N(2))-methyltransferase RsmD [Pseudoxanthomonas winnipegensis]